MKKQCSLSPLNRIPKRGMSIGITATGGLFLLCCLITLALSGCSGDKTNPSVKVPSASKAVSELATLTLVPSATIASTATSTTIPTSTTAPTATAAPLPTQIPAKLNDCLPDSAKTEMAKVVKVVDGDTIDVTIDGAPFTVRYIGMDTPETKKPDAPVEAYGPEASNRNAELVVGKEVVLVKDTSETDSFGRLLRYVFAGDVFVNEALVKEGFAQAKDYPPDTACSAVFASAQEGAKSQAVGLWSAASTRAETIPTLAPTEAAAPPAPAPTDTPAASSDGCPHGCAQQKPGCDIKGNINSDDVKIYHVPGSKNYNKTQIDPSNGERWFCTIEEAIANGWRAPKN